MPSTCFEIIRLKRFIPEFGIKIPTPIPLYANNTIAIQVALNPLYQERTKHVEVDCHFIREQFQDQLSSLPHITSH